MQSCFRCKGHCRCYVHFKLFEKSLTDAPFEVLFCVSSPSLLPNNFVFLVFLPSSLFSSCCLFLTKLKVNTELMPIGHLTTILLSPYQIIRLSTTSMEYSTISCLLKSCLDKNMTHLDHIWALRNSPIGKIIGFVSFCFKLII